MTITATQLFSFREHSPILAVQRHIFASAPFAQARRSLHRIVEDLRDLESDDSRELTIALQVTLLEWLTTPKSFNTDAQTTLASLGNIERIQERWGSRIAASIKIALTKLESLRSAENPLRTAFAKSIATLRDEEKDFRVYCHKSAIGHYQSALDEARMATIDQACFLHSVRDYRESGLFDALLKVGPLRTAGWSATPDAILTAPRYSELVHLVWDGCKDEPGFGYDPAAPQSSGDNGEAWYEKANDESIILTTLLHGDQRYLAEERTPALDEIALFREMGRRDGLRRALFVTVDTGHGVLLTPNSIISVLSKNGLELELNRGAASDVLARGAFLVRPILNDVDLGGTQAEFGHHSRAWKAKLARLASDDRDGLLHALKEAGINLVHLPGAVANWLRPPTTVIHAPQKISHFKILMEVLGVDERPSKGTFGQTWWQLAWEEIRQSRGIAIRDGVIEHEILEEQCMTALKAHMNEIRACAVDGQSFSFGFRQTDPIHGTVVFNRIEAIEDGYQCPESELRTLCELTEADRWRA